MANATYNPFTYRSLMQFFYNGSGHIAAAEQFKAWLKTRFPDVYRRIEESDPELLAPGAVPTVSPVYITKGGGLSGLGEGEGGSVISEWGSRIMDFGKQVLQLKGQQDLIKLNIARAEQGLPPVDQGSVAPQMNVGLAADTQKIVLYAVGGLALTAIFAALASGRKR